MDAHTQSHSPPLTHCLWKTSKDTMKTWTLSLFSPPTLYCILPSVFLACKSFCLWSNAKLNENQSPLTLSLSLSLSHTHTYVNIRNRGHWAGWHESKTMLWIFFNGCVCTVIIIYKSSHWVTENFIWSCFSMRKAFAGADVSISKTFDYSHRQIHK